jgi:hypothetical protein
MKSLRHYAMLCIEYGAISSFMVIRVGYKRLYTQGTLDSGIYISRGF